MSWEEGVVVPVALAALGKHYRRYRLATLSAAGAVGEAQRRGQGGVAFGVSGFVVGAAVDAVAGRQPRSGADVDAPAGLDRRGSDRRDRSVARCQPGAGSVRAVATTAGVDAG